MSDDLKIAVKITADASQLPAELKKSTDALQGLSASAGSAGGGLDTAGAAASGAAKSLADVADALEDVERVDSGALEAAADASSNMGEAATEAARGMEDMAKANAKATSGFSKTRAGIESISKELKDMRNVIGSLVVSNLGLSTVNDLIRLTDEYGQMASRIEMATAYSEEYEAVQKRLLDTASKTYRPLAEAQEMYIRTADALKSMGYNTGQALDVTDSLSYLMVTNAASGERAATAINAFAKSLQKGKVDAENWQSILAAVPTVVDKIAASSGRTTEEIRKMGAEGTLALRDLSEGLRHSLADNLADAEKMPTTVADAFTRLKTNLQAYMGEANRAGGYTSILTSALSGMADSIDDIFKGLGVLAAAGFGAILPKMTAFIERTVGMGVASMQAANAQRAAAQAALAEAQAELAAAEATLAHERAALATGASVASLAAAEARQAQAATALAAAQTRAVTTAGGMAAAAKGLAGFLGGPAGLALMAGTAALAFLTLRDNSKETQAALIDLGQSADAVREQFSKLGEAQQRGELSRAKKNNAELAESYRKLALDIAKSADDALSPWFSANPTGELANSLESLKARAHAAYGGMKTDWDALARMIAQTTGLSEAFRASLLEQIGAAAKAAGEIDDLNNKYQRMQEIVEQTDAGKGVANLAVSLDAARAAAKDLGIDMAHFGMMLSPEFRKASEQLDVLVSSLANLKAAGVDTGAVLAEALGKAIANAGNKTELDALSERIAALGKTGELTGKQIAAATRSIADRMRVVADNTRQAREAAAALGVELSSFSDRVSPEFEEVSRHLDNLVEGLEKARDSGIDTGAALKDAIGKAITGAKNPAELIALTDRIETLGKSGEIARPRMIELFNAVREKAREAGSEAAGLKKEIDDLLRQAQSIRSGQSGFGKQAADLRNKGRSQEAIDAEATRAARQAASDATFYASAAKSAQMDGRAEEAAKYATIAQQKMDEAAAAAGRISEDARDARLFDELADAEATAREAEVIAKQQELDTLEAATAAQEAQLSALETRLDELIAKAQSGVSLQVDTSAAQPQVDAIKAAIDAIPSEKTVTINVVENRTAGTSDAAAQAAAGFASGGFTGAIDPSRIAGVVHGREYVARAAVVAQPGARAFLDLFNRVGMAALPEWLKRVKLPGYRDGGYVKPASAASATPADHLIPAVFNFPGVGKVPVNVQPNVAAELARALKIESLMRGRR